MASRASPDAPQPPPEARFRAVVDLLRDGVALLDRDGRIVCVSQASERILGRPAAWFAGRNPFDFIHRDDAPRVAAALGEALAAPGREIGAELRIRHRDGRWVDLDLLGANHLDDPAVAALVVSVRDATERKKAEAVLRESEARLRSLGENLPGGGVYQYLHPADGPPRILSVSAGFERITGRTQAEFLSGGVAFFDLIDPADRDAAVRASNAAVGAVGSLDIRVRSAATPPRYWQFRSAPRRLPNGDTVCDGVLLDVTEQVRLEDQFRQAQKMESLGLLAGGVAHDFNNLLTVIVGNLDLLPAPADAGGRAILENVRAAAGRAADLTQKLLGFSRRRPLQPVPVDAGALLTETAAMLRRVIDPRIAVAVAAPPGLPRVRADAGAVQQALINLCLNARDAMPGGGSLALTARAAVTADPPDPVPPGTFVALSVSDSGTGMDPTTQARLFEPFFTTKPDGQGTGLGLPMVYGTAKQHGGWVAVTSAPGTGTRFDLYLPAVDPALTPPPAAGKKRVLIVDDDDGIVDLARAILSAQGYWVHAASTADAALAWGANRPVPPDLILLDLSMPGRPPALAVPEFRAHWPKVRILLSSGRPADDDLVATVDGVLQKPFTAAGLRAAVAAAVAGV